MASNRIDDPCHPLAAKLAERSTALLSPSDWKRVSLTLHEMYDQLQHDLPSESDLNEAFGGMIVRLIERLGSPDVASSAQAWVYTRSADSDHRDRAATWMKSRHH
jgi:hypothetical protein